MGCPSCSSSVRSMSKVGDRLVSSAWKDTTLSTGLGPAHPTLCIKREPHRVVLLQAATLVSNNNNNSNYTFQLMMSQVCARQILSLQSNLVYRVFQTKGAAQQTDRQTDRQAGINRQADRAARQTERGNSTPCQYWNNVAQAYGGLGACSGCASTAAACPGAAAGKPHGRPQPWASAGPGSRCSHRCLPSHPAALEPGLLSPHPAHARKALSNNNRCGTDEVSSSQTGESKVCELNRSYSMCLVMWLHRNRVL